LTLFSEASHVCMLLCSASQSNTSVKLIILFPFLPRVQPPVGDRNENGQLE
jgi:hypothetical protein